jgi:hypothetical protein
MGKRLTIILAVLAALPVLYVGAYFLNVQRGVDEFPSTFPKHVVRYAVGGCISEGVFRPIHEADRWLRPNYWGQRRLADPYDSEVFYP